MLPEKFHGQRNLADYIPRGCKESDMTEQQSTPFLPTYDNDSDKMDKNILISSSRPTNFPVPYPIIPSSQFWKKTVSLFKANPSNLLLTTSSQRSGYFSKFIPDFSASSFLSLSQTTFLNHYCIKKTKRPITLSYHLYLKK